MGADGDLVHIAENVQLGEGDGGSPLDLHAVAGGHQINRAYPAGPPGLGAVLAAGLPQLLSLFAEPLAGEGALAHAGGVGLHHAHHLFDLGLRIPGAHRGVGGDGVGGGGHGIDAVVQVPQGTQLGLKENALAVLVGLAQEGAGVTDEGLDLFAEVGHPGLQVLHGVGLGAVYTGQGQVLPLQNALQAIPELVRIQQLAGHDGLLLVLVGVEGGDALLGGAVLLVGQAGLLQTIQIPVPGQQQRGSVADLQIFRRDGNAFAGDVLDLRPQILTVQSHAVAQNIHHTGTENAGRQQV